LHGDYGYGEEFICGAETYKECKADLISYKQNDNKVSNLNIKMKRVKIKEE